MTMQHRVKNEHIKRKQICSLCFVNVSKFQENKFKIVKKNFLGNKNNINKKKIWKSHQSQWSLNAW